jgi:phage tail sheath protein FI
MPEYLSPGVYIEEVPPRLRAIEGVSTSTVGFVGVAERGPVPGFELPFNPSTVASGTPTIVLPPDPAPRLITSYGEFRRIFGGPLPLPDPNGVAYLERAVRAFFANGGKRCYISRVVEGPAATGTSPAVTATRGHLTLSQGAILHLARPYVAGRTEAVLNTLRGVDEGSSIYVLSRADNSSIGTVEVTSYDTTTNTITFRSALSDAIDPNDVYAISPGTASLSSNGPRFWARNPGSWSAALTVRIIPADKGPVPLVSDAGQNDDQIRVRSTASFYRGAIVEIDTGSARLYNEVEDILPNNVLVLVNGLGATSGVSLTDNPFARVVEIDVTIRDESVPVTETFRGLTWNPRNTPEIRRRYYAAVINARSTLAYVQPPGVHSLAGSESEAITSQPTTENGFEVRPVGSNVGTDNYTSIDYVGRDEGPGTRTGIQALADVDEISTIACPGRTGAAVQNALIAQCENLRYRFAILDGERDPTGGAVSAILAHRNTYDSSYAAYYQPWVEVIEGTDRHHLPPSGFLAGIYARTDNERGVHKAPANEVVRTATGLRSNITTGEQDVLNPRGVNVIRQFEGRGIRVWGARTLSSDPALRYVSTRRFLIFLEKSIDRGTQWVVFEPNNPDTWSRVTDSVGAFLHTQWRAGALLGRTPEQAFFVRCDESTMTADDIENGRLICEIGVAIVKPAEFVIFRIEQIAAFGETP